jgi:hypothetical protein
LRIKKVGVSVMKYSFFIFLILSSIFVSSAMEVDGESDGRSPTLTLAQMMNFKHEAITCYAKDLVMTGVEGDSYHEGDAPLELCALCREEDVEEMDEDDMVPDLMSRLVHERGTLDFSRDCSGKFFVSVGDGVVPTELAPSKIKLRMTNRDGIVIFDTLENVEKLGRRFNFLEGHRRSKLIDHLRVGSLKGLKEEDKKGLIQSGFFTVKEPSTSTNTNDLLNRFSVTSGYSFNTINRWGQVDWEQDSHERVIGVTLHAVIQACHKQLTPRIGDLPEGIAHFFCFSRGKE